MVHPKALDLEIFFCLFNYLTRLQWFLDIFQIFTFLTSYSVKFSNFYIFELFNGFDIRLFSPDDAITVLWNILTRWPEHFFGDYTSWDPTVFINLFKIQYFYMYVSFEKSHNFIYLFIYFVQGLPNFDIDGLHEINKSTTKNLRTLMYALDFPGKRILP